MKERIEELRRKLFPPMFVEIVLMIAIAMIGFFVPYVIIWYVFESVVAGTLAGMVGELWVLAQVLDHP
jgi:hypothetical protein